MIDRSFVTLAKRFVIDLHGAHCSVSLMSMISSLLEWLGNFPSFKGAHEP